MIIAYLYNHHVTLYGNTIYKVISDQDKSYYMPVLQGIEIDELTSRTTKDSEFTRFVRSRKRPTMDPHSIPPEHTKPTDFSEPMVFGPGSSPNYSFVHSGASMSFAPHYDSTVTPSIPTDESPKTETHSTGAVRSTDANDVRYDLISPQGLRRLAMTYDEGSKKYGSHNYKQGFPISGLMNHAIRHCYLFLDGDISEDHLAHAAWNLFTAIEMMELKPELDDRYVLPNAEKTS